MSVNTAHTSNGVLLHAGEFILLHCNKTNMQFSGQDSAIFHGCKCGCIYLTSHRMIFNSKKSKDDMQSFSAPFIALSELGLEQPILGSNYITGKVRAQPHGNFNGEVKFKLYFKVGGAIEFGRALSRAVSVADWYIRNGYARDEPPPYTSPNAWYEAPPPAYEPPESHTNWLPTHIAFSQPTPNTVFVSDNPPPYQGIAEASVFESITPAPQFALISQQQAQNVNDLRIQGAAQPQIGWTCADTPPPYAVCGNDESKSGKKKQG